MLKMKQLWFLFFVLENFNLNLLFLRLILKKKKPIMPKIFVYQLQSLAEALSGPHQTSMMKLLAKIAFAGFRKNAPS